MTIHEGYFMHIYNTLESAGVKCGKITHRIRKPDSRTGNVYTGLQFHVSASPYWTELRRILYPDSSNYIKIVPDFIGQFITPMDFGLWMTVTAIILVRPLVLKKKFRYRLMLLTTSSYISLVDVNRSSRG